MSEQDLEKPVKLPELLKQARTRLGKSAGNEHNKKKKIAQNR
jgi:hypothetical protein